MGKNQLIKLGVKVIQLSKVRYGNDCNPFEKVNDIANDTGIDQELILSALYTARDGVMHASQ